MLMHPKIQVDDDTRFTIWGGLFYNMKPESIGNEVPMARAEALSL